MDMGFNSVTRSRAFLTVISATLPLLLVAACGGEGFGGPQEQPSAPVTSTSRSSAALTMADGTVCSGTNAHDAHAFAAGCVLCHACGGTYGFTLLTLPRGTSTAGGEIHRTPAGTTCSVACHDQSGTSQTEIGWTATGPLACTSCHTGLVPTGDVIRSAHATALPDPAAERSGCTGCHELSAHVSGTVRISLGDGTYVDAGTEPAELDVACKSCHDGNGAQIGGQTPPLLVGYESPATGDFHGAREGTGFGGTLLSPYSRGQASLACATCHASHASANEFMIASEVNGMPIPAGVIDRAGVGAQLLCESCHEGPRHSGCQECHGVDPVPAEANTACFYCHGHEGIVNWPYIAPVHGDRAHYPDGCTHCHSPGWYRQLEYTPPVIANNGLVSISQLSGTSATITWTTDEEATSFVEYGIGTPNRVVGDGTTFRTSHSVTLSGLEEMTTYAFRVRTSDRFRNVKVSPMQSFSTVSPNAPLAPALVSEPDYNDCAEQFDATLQWSAVADPNGDPVQYRVMIDDGPLFDSPLLDTGWIGGTSYPVTVASGVPYVWYYWRVQARDAANDLPSPWSTVDAFYARFDETWCWY